ncbi:MAG: alginate lyase family protein [Clostridia bacterium]|nr:alginate lyase family protein [Clostridia bacterium]
MKEFLRRINLVVSPNYVPHTSCIECADKILNHELSVLGSQPAIIHYGMDCKGFEGVKHSNPNHSYEETKKKAYEVAPSYVEFMKKAESLSREISPDYKPIPWHLDIITGYVYDLVWHTEVPVAKFEGVDAKTPSDFSRMHYILTLAHAYRLTKNVKYRNEAMAQLLDWVAVNPPYYGPAWRNGMNVSIRATNIICTVSMLDISLDCEVDKKFLEIIYELILLHTKFITLTMEYRSEHNHMVAEACALTLTTSLYENEYSTEDIPVYNAGLDRNSWHLITKQIARQINEDGFDFENTTSYHAYVLEMFLYPTLHALRVKGCKNAKDFLEYARKHNLLTEESIERLRSSARALCMLTQPDGNIPYISDNDAGRYIEWEARDKHNADMRSLASTVAVLFSDSSIVPASARDVDFIASSAYFDDAKPIKSTFEYSAQVYHHIGFTIIANNDFHCVFSSGGNPEIAKPSHYGHSHNDQLSFTLCAKNKPFIIDSGTYTYTGNKAWRRKTRSVMAHNTVVIDGIETDERIASAQFGETAGETALTLVGLKKKITSLVNFEKTESKVVCTGEHVGYTVLPDKITVQRTLEYNYGNKLLIKDNFIRQEKPVLNGEITERFNLHSDCKVTINDNVAVIENNGDIIEISTEKGYFRTEQAFHAVNYGTKKDSTAVVIVLPRDSDSNSINIRW